MLICQVLHTVIGKEGKKKGNCPAPTNAGIKKPCWKKAPSGNQAGKGGGRENGAAGAEREVPQGGPVL